MKIRLLASVILFGIVAILLGWVYESQFKKDSGSSELVIPVNIDYFLTRLEFRAMNTDGEVDYEFSSPRLEHRPLKDISHIQTPTLQIYRSHEQWTVDSTLGQFQHADNLLKLQQDVVMQKQGDNPVHLTTETIQFEPDRDLVTIDSQVIMRTSNATITAQQAVFNLKTNHYSLKQIRTVYENGNS